MIRIIHVRATISALAWTELDHTMEAYVCVTSDSPSPPVQPGTTARSHRRGGTREMRSQRSTGAGHTAARGSRRHHRHSHRQRIHETGWGREEGEEGGKAHSSLPPSWLCEESLSPSSKPPPSSAPESARPIEAQKPLSHIHTETRCATCTSQEGKEVSMPGQAHRGPRAAASGQSTSSVWRRRRSVAAGVLLLLLRPRIHWRRLRQKKQRRERRRCRGASQTAMRPGASAQAFWPSARRISALGFGRDGGCHPRGSRGARKEGREAMWSTGRRRMAVYGEVGGGGQVGAVGRAYKGGGEKEENKQAACELRWREERRWRCGGLGLSTCLQGWGPPLLPL